MGTVPSLRTTLTTSTTGALAELATAYATITRLATAALPIFDVRDTAFAGGAKGDGTLAGAGTDDTAAVAAAAAALIAAGGGILYFPRSAGYYKVTTLPNLSMPTATGVLPYAVRGDGSAISRINLRGTSAAASLTVANPLFDPNSASTGAPEWSGFTIDGTGSSGDPTTITSGTSWQNTTGKDLLVTIPVAFTGTGTAAWGVDTYSGVPVASPAQAGGPSGMKVPVTFIHPADAWAILTVTAGTIGAPTIQYV